MGSIAYMFLLAYLLVGVGTASHLSDGPLKTGHAILAGCIWPFVTYRAIRRGYLTDFAKKLAEVTRN